ncbi:MAG: hypothetical protein ACK5SP_01635, partial [bacterium]
MVLVTNSLLAQEDFFTVKLDAIVNGAIELEPSLPADGKYASGTVVTVRAKTQDGFALDSIYYSVPGRWGAMYHESLTSEFEITIDQNKSIGASFIEADRVAHLKVTHNVVYARPGKKELKYDVYYPKEAENLPVNVIIHGGGWATNDEDIMRGLARELTKDNKFVVASVDYRWIGTLDGDEKPNSMAHLIEDVMQNSGLPLADAVRSALKQVVGAYAIVILSKNHPEHLIAARKGSPLVVGLGKDRGEFFFASDATPIVEYTNKVIYLKDGEVAIVEHKELIVKSIENVVQVPYVQELELSLEQLEKGGYPHFMLKEIYEQPRSIFDSFRGRFDSSTGEVHMRSMEDYADRLKEIKRLILIGCGT